MNKKYLHYKQQSSNKDLELKKKDIEIERLNKTQKTNEVQEDNRKPKKAIRRLNNSNPPQCGPPQCGLPQNNQNNEENPPQCGPSQCGLQQHRTEVASQSESDTGPEENTSSGYGLNSRLTPIGTPKRSQGSQERKKYNQDESLGSQRRKNYSQKNSSASENESTKRKGEQFKIPKVPLSSHKNRKDRDIEDRNRQIAELKKQLKLQEEEIQRSSNIDRKVNEEFENMTPAKARVIEQAIRDFNANTRILQAEKHYSKGSDITPKVVNYLNVGHPTFTTLDLQWTEKSDWYDLPRDPTQITNPNEDLEILWMARVEPYIYPEGNTKWAVSYGAIYTELVAWYDLEKVKKFFGNWTMPSKSRWANLQVWRKTAMLESFKAKRGSRDTSRNRESESRGARGYSRGSQNSGNRGSGSG